MAEKGAGEKSEEVIREILKYLIEYPDAKDTLDGISKWWRPNGKSERRKAEIQYALDSLVSKGWVTVREISPAQKIYGFNKKYIKVIRACLVES